MDADDTKLAHCAIVKEGGVTAHKDARRNFANKRGGRGRVELSGVEEKNAGGSGGG